MYWVLSYLLHFPLPLVKNSASVLSYQYLLTHTPLIMPTQSWPVSLLIFPNFPTFSLNSLIFSPHLASGYCPRPHHYTFSSLSLFLLLVFSLSSLLSLGFRLSHSILDPLWITLSFGLLSSMFSYLVSSFLLTLISVILPLYSRGS